MSKIASAVQGMKDLIYWMNGANVPTNIPAGHIYPAMSPAMTTQKDEDYPKVVLPIDGGRNEEEPNRTVRKTVTFDVLFIFKETPLTPAQPDAQGLDVLEDFPKAIAANYTLGGAVENAKITDWTTDSGFSWPEGITWFKVEVEFRDRY